MKEVVANIGHSAIAKVAVTGVQVATGIVLARLLDARDFGVVGFATIMIALLSPVNRLGMGQALVRAPELDERLCGTALRLQIGMSLLCFVASHVVAVILGRVGEHAGTAAALHVLAFGFLMNPIGFLQSSVLVREMRFGVLRTPTVVGAAVRGLVSIGAAFAGWGFWSLVAGGLAGIATTNLLLALLRRGIRVGAFCWKACRQLLAFGLPLTVAGLVTFAVFHADRAIIGSMLGTSALGYYTIALSWATMVSTTLVEVVHSVLLPKFAQLQDSPPRMKLAFLRSLRVIGVAAVAGNASLAVMGRDFVVHVLGGGTEQWLPALPALYVLCVYGIVRACTETLGNPILALGQCRLLLKAAGVAAVMECILVPLGIWFGDLWGAAAAMTVAYATQWILYGPFLAQSLGVTRRDIGGIVWPLFCAGAAGVLVGAVVPVPGGPWLRMVLSAGLCLGIFLALHEGLSHCALIREWKAVAGAFRRGNPRASLDTGGLHQLNQDAEGRSRQPCGPGAHVDAKKDRSHVARISYRG